VHYKIGFENDLNTKDLVILKINVALKDTRYFLRCTISNSQLANIVKYTLNVVGVYLYSILA